jgi:hypothetical protein
MLGVSSRNLGGTCRAPLDGEPISTGAMLRCLEPHRQLYAFLETWRRIGFRPALASLGRRRGDRLGWVMPLRSSPGALPTKESRRYHKLAPFVRQKPKSMSEMAMLRQLSLRAMNGASRTLVNVSALLAKSLYTHFDKATTQVTLKR